MATCTVKLNSVEKVKSFVEAISNTEAKMELVSESYVINAKSIMAIFCLDLTKPIQLRTYANSIPTEVFPYLA